MGSSSPQNAATSTLEACAPRRGHRSRPQPITNRVSLWTGVNDPGYNRLQGLGAGVGRTLGVAWARGVGVGLGVAVAVGVGVGPPLGDTRT
jgi:hypothetical protein